MDSGLLVDLVPSLALGIALAACAGLRAWLPLLMAGGAARLGLLQLGPSFHFLSGNRALIVFAVATVLEMAADKIPAVDHTLDLLSTFLRPAAGALLAASVLGKISDPLLALALGTAVGAPAALVPHAAKSATRIIATGLTAGLANPILSLVEDVLAVVSVFLALLVPLLMAMAVLLLALLLLRRVGRSRTVARPA